MPLANTQRKQGKSTNATVSPVEPVISVSHDSSQGKRSDLLATPQTVPRVIITLLEHAWKNAVAIPMALVGLQAMK